MSPIRLSLLVLLAVAAFTVFHAPARVCIPCATPGVCTLPVGLSDKVTKAGLAAIHGKIQVVDTFPDFKVKVVDALPDLRVQVVENFPDKPGKWQFVDTFPDYKIQFVDALPDFTIQFVDAFPGVP